MKKKYGILLSLLVSFCFSTNTLVVNATGTDYQVEPDATTNTSTSTSTNTNSSTTATVTVDLATAEKTVKEALTQKTFYHFNVAYLNVVQLTNIADRDALLTKLSTIQQTVRTGEIDKALSMLDDMIKTGSARTYAEIEQYITNSKMNTWDKGYLLGELTSWGKDLVWTKEYSDAYNALISAWTKKDLESVNKTEILISQIENVPSREYLSEQLDELKGTLIFEPLAVKEIAKKSASIVTVEAQHSNGQIQGSGIIIDSNGIIATSFDTINGAESANVTLSNGKKYEVKGVLGYSKELNIAILKLEGAYNLTAAALGDSDKVEIGEEIVAIGTSGGFSNTLSTGIVNGLDRQYKRKEGKDIQINTNVVYGASGGALFNMYGHVIGLIYSSLPEGTFNFVIPANEIKPLLYTNVLTPLSDVNASVTPLKPTGLTAKIISSNEIILQWNPVTNADYYYVYYSGTPDGTFDVLKNSDGSKKTIKWSSDFSASFNNFTKGSTIFFKVTSVKDDIESPYSNMIFITTKETDGNLPLLSYVSAIPNVNYISYEFSEDGTEIYYSYSQSSLPENYFVEYVTLLMKNGWTYYNGEKPETENPTTYLIKNDNIITITFTDKYMIIGGKIK